MFAFCGQLRKLETIQDFNSGGWLPFEMFGVTEWTSLHLIQETSCNTQYNMESTEIIKKFVDAWSRAVEVIHMGNSGLIGM